MPEKIEMKTPLVEMDGDEMTRIIWAQIKEKLISPFIELKTEYYDLSLQNRNATDDKVTVEAAEATKRMGVAVKCATVTVNAQRMEEYPELRRIYPSPNATIRGILDGTVFRAPIIVKNISPIIKSWKSPIIVARHAHGDIYRGVEIETSQAGEATLTFSGESGEAQSVSVAKPAGGAVFLGMHNTVESIKSFARSCFQYAAGSRTNLWFSTKDTISKTYDGAFKRIFDEEYLNWRDEFDEIGIEYFYTLIDDAVARAMRSEGGFIWALKNYDGDVMSDMISTAFGSLAMMTSVLVSPDGKYEYEAAHGTVTRHYYRYLRGEETSTNPVATIFAWSGALARRGEMDNLPRLKAFAALLEEETRSVIESGAMTGDLVNLAEGEARTLSTKGFLDEVADRISSRVAAI